MECRPPSRGGAAISIDGCVGEDDFLAACHGARAGWIDFAVCKQLLTQDIRILAPVDGSERAMTGLTYVCEGWMQHDKTAFVCVLHVYDEGKTYLPYNCQKDRLQTSCEAILESSVSHTRFRLDMVERKGESTWHHICKVVSSLPANYVCMGFFGLKYQDKLDQDVNFMGTQFSSNVFHLLNMGKSCGVICIKEDSPDSLPMKRPATYVVSVNLSRPAMKAFFDVLRFSKPGDVIHAVYVRSFVETQSHMETDSGYSSAVCALYEILCRWIRDRSVDFLAAYNDRTVDFVALEKRAEQTVPEVIVNYAEDLGVDFLAVGANSASRVARGKPPVGTTSLRICLATKRNVIVSSWLDVSPKVYESCVRGALAPP